MKKIPAVKGGDFYYVYAAFWVMGPVLTKLTKLSKLSRLTWLCGEYLFFESQKSVARQEEQMRKAKNVV